MQMKLTSTDQHVNYYQTSKFDLVVGYLSNGLLSNPSISSVQFAIKMVIISSCSVRNDGLHLFKCWMKKKVLNFLS